MPLVIETEFAGSSIGLEELADYLHQERIDTEDADSLAGAATMLGRLASNKTFLSDVALRELKSRKNLSSLENSYTPQSMVLVPFVRSRGNFFIRANFWPSSSDHILKAGSESDFLYHAPHDHSFNFLTVGYHGPGYSSNYYEYEYEDTHGYVGEQVPLRFVENSSLTTGKIMLYRAFKDVHDQSPGETMSISLNIMESSPRGTFMDQYGFDIERMEINELLNRSSAASLFPILAAIEEDNARDFLADVARNHVSGRIRCLALDAMASVGDRDAACEVYLGGSRSRHGQVSGHSRCKLDNLNEQAQKGRSSQP